MKRLSVVAGLLAGLCSVAGADAGLRVHLQDVDGTALVNALVMAHTATPPAAPAQPFAYVLARTDWKGIAHLRVDRLSGPLVLSVATTRGFVHAPIDKAVQSYRLAPCEVPLAYEVLEVGRSTRQPPARPLDVVAARSFTDPPRQFALPASQRHHHSVCLPPADYVVHSVEPDRSVGPVELSTEGPPGTARIEIRHGPTRPALPRGARTVAGSPADMIAALATRAGPPTLIGLGENSHGSANLVDVLRDAVRNETLGPIAVLAMEIDAIAARHVDNAL